MKEEEKRRSSKHIPENKERYPKAISVTYEVLSLNLIIIGGGYYLDNYVGFKIPWILIASIPLSVAATIYYLLKKFGS